MIRHIIKKALASKRMTPQDALELFERGDLLTLIKTAEEIRFKYHSEKIVTYLISRNINYTNICISRCDFCAFSRDKTAPDAYVLSEEEIAKKIIEAKNMGAVRILLQGGLHPEFNIKWYERLVRFIKQFNVHMHGFSPPEIWHFARLNKISVKEVLERLRDSGLESIPGGGAEILSGEIRAKISPRKCPTSAWLDVMRTAHLMGIRTTATMMFGHIESYRHRVEHLLKIRQLQDETGGFFAFIPWTFQPENTKMQDINSTDAVDYLKTLSISRIFLDNIPNIQGSWLTQGAKVGQLSLKAGANDFGDTVIEENVVREAGVKNWLTQEQIRTLIKDAGFIPKLRNTFYEILE
jgi:cyclic dehypoxanthinyl futalosine synthase